jgi:hypothetical protein
MAILCDKKTHLYYFPTNEPCSVCGCLFAYNQLAAIRIIPRQKTYIFCEHCLSHIKKISPLGQKIMGRAVKGLVANTFVVDEKRPLPMKDGEIDPESILIDHTKIANRDEYSQMDMPDRISLDELDKKLDAPFSINQIESHLKDQTPIIPSSNLIENKEQKCLDLKTPEKC